MTKAKQTRIFIILVFLFIVLFVWQVFSSVKYLQLDKYNNLASLHERYFILDEATTPGEQQLGLSFRDPMCARCGMLFAFAGESQYSFWMKDMKFNLDMVYLDDGKKVVEIFENFKKDSYPESYRNKVLARYVLELNAGAVEKYGIKVGDMLDY